MDGGGSGDAGRDEDQERRKKAGPFFPLSTNQPVSLSVWLSVIAVATWTAANMRFIASRPCEDPVTSRITPRDEGAAAEQRRLHDQCCCIISSKEEHHFSGASDLNDCNSPVDHHLDCQPGVSSTGSERDQTWHKEAHQVSKEIDVFLRRFSPKSSAGLASLGFPAAASSQTPQLTPWCARSSSPTVTVKYFNQCLTLLAWPPPQECGGVRRRLHACAVAATAAFGTSGGSCGNVRRRGRHGIIEPRSRRSNYFDKTDVGVAQQLRIYQSLLGPGGPLQ
ncbi:hypothetical protein DFJ73DRAFT_232145 [Zopfochytrium polystomum]|nr:hypothetical protein DFJ73DRAFT_232145 [Zopfochytrium polystomum]